MGVEIEAIFYLIVTFQRVDFPILEKVLGCKSGETIFTSQKGKEVTYNDRFSKINALRKGNGETSVVRPSGFYKGRDEKEVKGIEAERSQAQEIVKTVCRNMIGFALLTLYPST